MRLYKPDVNREDLGWKVTMEVTQKSVIDAHIATELETIRCDPQLLLAIFIKNEALETIIWGVQRLSCFRMRSIGRIAKSDSNDVLN